MPKLNKTEAKAVNETEAAQGFALLPSGLYAAVLVEVKADSGDKGPYWIWEYKIPDGYPSAGRKFWNNTSLSESSRPFLKKTFDAFGVPADTDTDSLLGKWVMLRVNVRTIQQGAKKGEQVNGVSDVLPYDTDADPEADDAGGDQEPF